MPRNLDMTALRAFAAVAETGGVTKAAGYLNLTQSAVSMQLKRLEQALDAPLLDRAGRGIALTPQGEQVLSYARRMLALNDEVFAKLTADEYEGEIRLGVPHDIVPRAIPQVLQRFAVKFPRMRIKLISSFTNRLIAMKDRGECDIILTTEDGVRAGGETLMTLPLVWVGAPDGVAWRQRPLPMAFEENCIFRPHAQRALDAEGIPWQLAVSSDSTRTIEATVGADLAVHVMMAGMCPPYIETVAHGDALPPLPLFSINLYTAGTVKGQAEAALIDMLRSVYGGSSAVTRQPSRLSAVS